MKKVSFHTLGCKVNFAETSTLARGYEAEGFVRVGERAEADVYVVNSCSVTAAADKKCRNLIARLHRRSPLAQIVVGGCYAARVPGEVASLPGVTRVLERDMERFCGAYSAGDRTRSFLKVQDGCDYRCSYCTIHSARGSSRNGSVASLVSQAREIASTGVREIVLTGVNTGDFGRTTGESFLSLLSALDGVEGIERYRISSIEPNLLTDQIIDFCAASRAFQPHFHIPLQSGCDRILGLMRRRYTTAKFADRIARVRSVMPDAFFGIDVIVGFPGETDEDFEETFEFLSLVRPAQLHVFPYSVRPGTPAAEMPLRVSPKVAAARAARLGALSEQLLAEFYGRFSGCPARVLWEGGGDSRSRAASRIGAGGAGRSGGEEGSESAEGSGGGLMGGFTGNYIRVTAPYDPARVNKIVEVTLP
ncbi:MAG: MiaB/RimO family radical SAM methylthiotransferase [Alistipes sp.]|jgi:threonylcarbamoyladenosine tRNA methylthiotransferase MtaB|nr:MiaB/RimO family radical SAM methylthiotransferase [Alistipes sp.]